MTLFIFSIQKHVMTSDKWLDRQVRTLVSHILNSFVFCVRNAFKILLTFNLMLWDTYILILYIADYISYIYTYIS